MYKNSDKKIEKKVTIKTKNNPGIIFLKNCN